MGLDIRVETRSGDTPSDRKARQRARPPHVLLTTPESLSLLLSYPDSDRLFADLDTVILDEIHAFAREKRGDLLSLALSRLQALRPELRRVGLSATVSDPDAYRCWLAPDADIDAVDLVIGDPGAEPDLSILIPDGRIPWGGHSGRHAAREVMKLIEQHKTTLVFCNTRSLAELIFQELWTANDNALPIGIHHGSLALEARRKVEAAMGAGRLRALVCTASLDLGIDWGDVDLVVQMGAPKGSLAPAAADRPRQPPPRRAVAGHDRPRQPLRISRGARGARRGRGARARPRNLPPRNARCPRPAHPRGRLLRARSRKPSCSPKSAPPRPIAGLTDEVWRRVLDYIATGGYSLRAYDKFKRLVEYEPGRWRITRPAVAAQHRMNAGVIVDKPMMDVRFNNGRMLGRVEEGLRRRP